jgi:hypothetical protein
MSNKSPRSLGMVDLEDEWVGRTVDIIQEELQVPIMDMEQRESLERVVMMSIAFYMMFCRESMNKTTRLTQ